VSAAALAGTGLAALVLALLVVSFVRAMTTPKPRPKAAPLGPESAAAFAGAEHRLAELIRIPSISSFDPSVEDEAAFRALRDLLPRLWPRVAASIPREEVGDRALLYAWEGRDPGAGGEPGAKPVILAAHFDVVPPGDPASWGHAPFSGDIEDGWIWGRGSQDIKVLLAAVLEAAESLLAEGFVPRRRIYFAFGGDEEVGGNRGAGRIAARLRERGVSASFLLDEGGPVGEGLISFADRPMALVAISEKGYMDLLLEARGTGGHASMPPSRTAVGDLARAVAELEAHPAPARLGFTVRNFLAELAPYSPFAYRLLFRNLGLFAPLVKIAFSASPSTNALLRSSFAPTMLEGSPATNVLASKAKAVINVRVLPGESTEKALKRVAARVARFGVVASAASPANVVEPSPESPVDHEGWRAIGKALQASFPEAAAVPFLLSGGTDTKHYQDLVEATYRFTALRQDSRDLEGIHAKDERVAVENYRKCVLFYRSLIAAL